MKKALLIMMLISCEAYSQDPPQPKLNCDPLTPISLANPLILGDGTANSITISELQAALDQGGHIFLDQGPNPSSVVLNQTLLITKETVIDGGGLVTFDGDNQHRIMTMGDPDFEDFNYTLTIQNLRFVNGFVSDQNGAAINSSIGQFPFRSLSLRVINSVFENNHASMNGPDLGGGAIYATGLRNITISGSSFLNNSGSNGGAIVSLVSEEIKVVDSTFQNNVATGDRPSHLSAIGDGGAIYIDGADREVRICTSNISNNRATALGHGFFTVMYDKFSRTDIVDTLIYGNISELVNIADTNSGGGIYVMGSRESGCVEEPFNDNSPVTFEPCGFFTLERSAVIGNRANLGGGLHIAPYTRGIIRNTTISDNIAEVGLGGGMFIDSNIEVEMLFDHLTIARNQAPGFNAYAGGVHVNPINQITLANSILSNNTGGTNFGINNNWNITNPVLDGGGNIQFPLLRPNNEVEGPATSSVLFIDPLLNNIANNGGPTPTMSLLPDSPAIDFTSSITLEDQRSQQRDISPDSGSFEFFDDLIFRDTFDF